MSVKELRTILEKYDNKDKDKIIIELYKRIPKRVKEDHNIDAFLENINQKQEKKQAIITIEELEKEVNYFIQCVNEGLYVMPNKIISKTERSKWRFKAKRYYKELNQFLPSTKEGELATILLTKLFKVLSVGTHSLSFSNWDTFKALGVPQSEFYENIIKRKLINGIKKDNLSYCIDLLYIEYDHNESHQTMSDIFISCLKTTDAKYLAIEILNEYVEKQKEELKNTKRDTYNVEFYLNLLVECILDIYLILCEVDIGIKYFHKNYKKSNNEVKVYILLEKLEEQKLINEWIVEYENHIGKIDYRDILKEKYNFYKNKTN